MAIARGCVVEKLKKTIRRFDEDVITEIVHLAEAYWLHEGKNGKFRLGIGQTDLVVLAIFLSAGIGTDMTAKQIAESLDLNVSTIESVVRDLQTYLLQKTGYILEGKAKTNMWLVTSSC